MFCSPPPLTQPLASDSNPGSCSYKENGEWSLFTPFLFLLPNSLSPLCVIIWRRKLVREQCLFLPWLLFCPYWDAAATLGEVLSTEPLLMEASKDWWLWACQLVCGPFFLSVPWCSLLFRHCLFPSLSALTSVNLLMEPRTLMLSSLL